MSIKNKCLLTLLLLLSITVNAQTSFSIPGYTAYAVPVEETDSAGESKLFTKQNGIQNWSNSNQQIQFYFNIRSIGLLELSLFIKNDHSGNKLSADFAGKKFNIEVPGNKVFTLVKIGKVDIKETGFYLLTLSCKIKKGKTIAAIKSLELSGVAAKDVHFNSTPRRNAASVHLFYPIDDSMKVTSFYNEITIPKGADVLQSYYMACGFSRGYFGIQVNSSTERRVIFSVWDAGNEAVDRNKVADENKVQLVAKGEDVFADGFGNEGTGGHSHWIYNWQAGETYRFLVTVSTDSATATSSYAGYFFIPELQLWKLIACFKAPKDGKPLRKLYSFVENFEGNNGQLFRKAFFGNQWIGRENGEWKELTHATFSYDASGKAGDRIDYGGGTDSNRFYLWNGGYQTTSTRYGDHYSRPPITIKPVIDLYKNADSASQLAIENTAIINAINKGELDTTGTLNGIYYKIINEGNGRQVKLSDSILVHYKGSLMNGQVFYQSKEKAELFHLKRLIKGWQIGMPLCRQGGNIKLIIPSYLAYSIRNRGKIPPNSTLIFEIEVVAIKSASL